MKSKRSNNYDLASFAFASSSDKREMLEQWIRDNIGDNILHVAVHMENYESWESIFKKNDKEYITKLLSSYNLLGDNPITLADELMGSDSDYIKIAKEFLTEQQYDILSYKINGKYLSKELFKNNKHLLEEILDDKYNIPDETKKDLLISNFDMMVRNEFIEGISLIVKKFCNKTIFKELFLDRETYIKGNFSRFIALQTIFYPEEEINLNYLTQDPQKVFYITNKLISLVHFDSRNIKKTSDDVQSLINSDVFIVHVAPYLGFDEIVKIAVLNKNISNSINFAYSCDHGKTINHVHNMSDQNNMKDDMESIIKYYCDDGVIYEEYISLSYINFDDVSY